MRLILKIYGILLMLISISFLPPLAIETWLHESVHEPFKLTILVSFLPGLLLWSSFRNQEYILRVHDGFIIVVLYWVTMSIIGSLPLYWSPEVNISFTSAFFEAVSGITTSGATVIDHLEHLPHSILYYRQQLQFIGGISFIVLAVALLPALGIGGMQIFRNETTGPDKDDKLTPHVRQTAKLIWAVYVTITLVCAIGYYFAGMTAFDAICHSFSTVSTGGFSTHDANFAYFSQPVIRMIAIAFMCIGAMNFNLHFIAFHRRSIQAYFQNAEWRGFMVYVFICCFIPYIALYFYNGFTHSNITLLDVAFDTVSVLTTTGYMYSDIGHWPGFIPMFIMFTCVIGACTGSTGGGIKIIRALLLKAQGLREIKRLIHPRIVTSIHLDKTVLSPRTIDSIWSFFVVYCAVFTVLLMLLLAANEDFYTAYTALIGSINNAGRGLGGATFTFANFSDFSLWVLSAAMLLGRLEIFTFLVLFFPGFWRR